MSFEKVTISKNKYARLYSQTLWFNSTDLGYPEKDSDDIPALKFQLERGDNTSPDLQKRHLNQRKSLYNCAKVHGIEIGSKTFMNDDGSKYILVWRKIEQSK